MKEGPIRVLHVINSLSPSGGAEHGLVREVIRFEPGTEQLVVTLYGTGQLESQLSSAGIETQDLGLEASQSGWNWPLGTRRLRSVIADFSPDVIHSSLFSANLVAHRASAGAATVPTLSTLTQSGDMTLHRSLQPGARSWYAAVLRQVAARAARSPHVWFRAITKDAADTSVSSYGLDPSRVVVIPRGVPRDLVSEAPKSREELGLPEGIPIILNVGRQSAQKGQIHLVAALAEILRNRPVHLVILGREGDATSQLTVRMEELDVENSVTIVPYTDRIGDYLANADVFAFPSLMEGLGTAVIEAMMAGLPVVGFDIPPVREITDRGRLADLVPVGDSGALARQLDLTLGSNGDVKERTLAAVEWAGVHFDIGAVARRVFELLRQVAAAGHDGR